MLRTTRLHAPLLLTVLLLALLVGVLTALPAQDAAATEIAGAPTQVPPRTALNAPRLSLTKTVGLATDTDCPPVDRFEIVKETDIKYCYLVTNTGDVTLKGLVIEDDMLGSVLDDPVLELAPGMTESLKVIVSGIVSNTRNVATATMNIPAGAGGKHADPVGDTKPPGTHDIIEFRGATDGNSLSIGLSFNGPVGPPGAGDPNEILGVIPIDADQDPNTGFANLTGPACGVDAGTGDEFFLDLSSFNPANGTVLLFSHDKGPKGEVPIIFGPTEFDINIPLALLDGDDGIANLTAAIGVQGAPTDCAPNAGFITSGGVTRVFAVDTADVVIQTAADLNILKGGPGLAEPNEVVSYTLMIQNGGPDDVESYFVNDFLPAGTTFVSFSPPEARCSLLSAGIIECLPPALGVGKLITIEIQIRMPDRATKIVNRAKVGFDGIDPEPNDNESFRTTIVGRPSFQYLPSVKR